jgi:hypothetical protein
MFNMASKSKQTPYDANSGVDSSVENPSSTSREVTEYTLKSATQSLFTHADLEVVKAKKAHHILADNANGADNKYVITKRVVMYEGEGEIPKGEKGIGLKGEVTESEEI